MTTEVSIIVLMAVRPNLALAAEWQNCSSTRKTYTEKVCIAKSGCERSWQGEAHEFVCG